MRSLQIIATFWYQNYLAFKPHFWGFFVYHGLTPFIFLCAFGLFGQQLYQHSTTLEPSLFILSGFFCFAGLIGAFTNMIYDFYWDFSRGQFHALYVTKASLTELFFSRCIWSASRTLISAIFTLTAGSLLLNIWLPLPIMLLSLGILFICNLIMTTFAMLFVAYVIYHHHTCDNAKLIEVSMVSFSGVFIPVTLFPAWIESAAHIFPLYHAIDIIRTLWTGHSILPHLSSLLTLCGISIACFLLATRKLKQRIIS